MVRHEPGQPVGHDAGETKLIGMGAAIRDLLGPLSFLLQQTFLLLQPFTRGTPLSTLIEKLAFDEAHHNDPH